MSWQEQGEMPLYHLCLGQSFYSLHKIVKCWGNLTHLFLGSGNRATQTIAGVVKEKAKCIIVLGWCWKSVIIMKVKTDCKEGIQVVPQRNLYFTIPWKQSPFPWSLLTCHGVWVSYNDKACTEARKWLPQLSGLSLRWQVWVEVVRRHKNKEEAFRNSTIASMNPYLNFIHSFTNYFEWW